MCGVEAENLRIQECETKGNSGQYSQTFLLKNIKNNGRPQQRLKKTNAHFKNRMT